MKVAGIPPSRILIFGQSLDTSVTFAAMKHFALQPDPRIFAGAVLVAPFVNVAMLASTFKVVGTLPTLSPLLGFSLLFNNLQHFLTDKWQTKDHLAQYV